MAIFELEDKRGHLKWKTTELVRNTAVSRQLIYRYFGSSKKEFLTTAVFAFCHEFYGFGEGELNLAGKIGEARERLRKYPEAVIFYQKWRARESFLQQEFIRVETMFQKKLKKIFPDFSQKQVLQAHACIHGLVTSPFLTAEQAEGVFRSLEAKGVF